MNVQDALQLKRRDRVWIDYKPNPGHGPWVLSFGIVQVTPTIISSHMGVEYVGVLVRPVGTAQRASVYPSWCLENKN
jgi:hypothetical protein